MVLPIAYEFAPDLIVVSAGFDAAAGDPIGGCASHGTSDWHCAFQSEPGMHRVTTSLNRACAQGSHEYDLPAAWHVLLHIITCMQQPPLRRASAQTLIQ